MKKLIPFLILALILTLLPPGGSSANTAAIQLGSDVLFDRFHPLIEGKKVGLLTNQTGVNSQGTSTIDLLRRDRSVTLTALFAPPYGLDGRAQGGTHTDTFLHPVYGIPVFSLDDPTRQPTADMWRQVDTLLVDLQDIGARTSPYLSALQYAMTAAKEQGKQVIILDRPNPLGGTIVEGPVLEKPYQSSIGVDELPLAHGMTIGELALFFNRSIGVDLYVVPMQGYTRTMLYPETGLNWVPPSPPLPDLTSVYGYMATGLGAGTPVTPRDYFTWVGAEGIDSVQYADLMNGSLLPGVLFLPEKKEKAGGVRLHIYDPRSFRPVQTGMYALAYARQLQPFPVPLGTDKEMTLFEQMMGTNKIGQLLAQGKSPHEIVDSYADALNKFTELRKRFLIYNDVPFVPVAAIHSQPAVPGTTQTPDTATPAPKPGTAQPPDTATPAPKPGTAQPPDTATPAPKPGTAQPPGTATPAPKPGTAQPPGTAAPAPKPGTAQPPGTTAPAPKPGTAQPPGTTAPAPKPGTTQPPGTTAPAPKPPASPAPKPGEKIAYLTFDDGPSPVTPHILDTLKKYQVKATFFIVGRHVPGNEAILKRAVAEGHAIGGHTYSHDYQVVYKSTEAFFADLEKGNQLIEKAIGTKPVLFRYPGGSTNTVSLKYQDPKRYNNQKTVMSAIKAEANKKGYTFIDWNVTNGDARSNHYTAQQALANIKQQVKSQKEIVVLMHDASTKSPTAQALPEVIAFLQAKGYRFAAISPDHPTVSHVK
ncbi:exo-beta-N-acetylmuramidase NamZ domain-containing protein [Brevibacillus sp. SAFN-007a]|uniref:exo-beta-N-acetylmuramidase NamZ domain-containing protein n=1 Tax=Brevibacillus sp. SAFN-007a TaxID=3436862 RepID=UPI003F7FFC44